MTSFVSIFDYESRAKIVQKAEERISIKKDDLVQIGYLHLFRNNSDRSKKKYVLVLTRSSLYYVNGEIKFEREETTFKSRARIDISWLRTAYYVKKDPVCDDNQYFFEMIKGNKSVIFCCTDFEEYIKWVNNLSYLTIQSNFSKKYKLGKGLGEGASARVYSLLGINSNITLACKKFSKKGLGEHFGLDNLVKEITILRTLKGHPNIVDLIEVQETENSIYLITELLEGGRVTKRDKKYNVDDSTAIGYAVLSAIVHMNNHMVVHRDLKPGNILLKYANQPIAENQIKVIDFGISTFYNNQNQPFKSCGTIGYLAPENITSEKNVKVSPISDVFSLGVILFNALTGTRLFIKSDEQSTVMANRQAEINFYNNDIKPLHLNRKIIS